MRTHLPTLCILIGFLAFQSANASAVSKKLGLEFGLGFNSTYGLLGLGGRYLISQNQDLHINTGVDLSGAIVAVGSRFYVLSSENKCFFIFSCKPRYFIGATALRSNESTITAESDGAKGEYKQSEGYASQITGGSYDTFGESFTMGFELGYRSWLKRPATQFQSGTFLPKHQIDLEKHVADSIAVGLSFGWLF